MKRVSGFIAALALAGAASAQQPTNTVEAIPPGQVDLSPAVGPDELRDFDLGGDAPAPAPTTTPTQPQQAPSQVTAPPQPAPQQPAPTRPAPVTSREAPPPSAAPSASQSQPSQAEPEVIDRGGATETLSPLPPISESPVDAADQPTRTIRLPGEAASDEAPWWPYALGLVALLGGLFFWLRQRQRGLALAQSSSVVSAESDAVPAPKVEKRSPKPAAPAPTPAPRAAATKPDFAIDFAPIRASLSESEFVIDYAMTLSNKGEAMARDVSIDVAMIMAGHDQEERIGKFVDHPPAERTVAVQALNSFGQAPLRGSVRLTGQDLTAINLDGRQLLLPTLVFLPRHRDGKAEPIRFVVGRKPQGSDKLAPMRGDLGPRVWRDLEARRA